MLRIRRSTAALAALLLLGGCARDAGPTADPLLTQSGDVYIVFHGFVFDQASALLPAEVIGEMAYELQEGTHESITSLTGARIDHYYVWVCIGRDCIPVDPFHFSN